MKTAFLSALLVLKITGSSCFIPKPFSSRSSTILEFKKGEGDDSNKKSFFSGLIRFIPGIIRAKFDKTYSETKPEPGNIYEVRLLNPININRRHVITRIIRFCPGTTWETAEDIVNNATKEGVAVIRIFNSMVWRSIWLKIPT